MKNLDLNGLGVHELNATEMREMGGGWFQLLVAVMGVGIYCFNNWGDFKEGFKEGYESVK